MVEDTWFKELRHKFRQFESVNGILQLIIIWRNFGLERVVIFITYYVEFNHPSLHSSVHPSFHPSILPSFHSSSLQFFPPSIQPSIHPSFPISSSFVCLFVLKTLLNKNKSRPLSRDFPSGLS